MIRRNIGAPAVASDPKIISDMVALNPCTPRSAFEPLPPLLEPRIAARWKVWVPWVRIHLLRARQSDPSVDVEAQSRRFRQRHSEHILDMLRAGITMRTIRRHRLDDPRLTDEMWAVLLQAAKERQSKAWYRRPDDQRAEEKLARLIRLGPIARNATATNAGNESTEVRTPAAAVILDPPALRETIQAIRRQVCEHFYLREMRDPELTVRASACLRPSASDRHVHCEAAHGRVAPGNRQAVWRQASHHGAALHQQDRSHAPF